VTDDAALDRALDRARTHDASGFDELFRALGPAILGYLRARNVSDPEGLTNEVFVRAFRGVRSFDGDSGRFRTWLYSIARNAAIDESRKRRRRPVQAELAHAEPVGGDVEEEALAQLQNETVRVLLDGLAPDQREVLMLRVVADLSIAQTAAVVNKSHEAVKALQHRALAALRRSLAQGESEPEQVEPTLRATT
jgi:RNA polymerase sigma-70 factor, ECF subfamily